MNIQRNTANGLLVSALWLAAIWMLPSGAEAQTHLFPEVNVVNITSYSAINQATASIPSGTTSLNVKFNSPTVQAAITWNVTNADWNNAAALLVDISNLGSTSAGGYIIAYDTSGNSAAGIYGLDPGESMIAAISLVTNFKSYGMDAPPSPIIGPGVVWANEYGWVGAGFDFSHVDHVTIEYDGTTGYGVGTAPGIVNVRSIRVAKPVPQTALYTGIMDQFGQYAHGSWPTKITTKADLAARLATENADLAAHPGPTDRDAYGGWANGPTLAATGFFRTAQYNGKWWLVTPSGHLFYSVGIQLVFPSYGPTTVIADNVEYMITGPGPSPSAYGYDYYGGNVNQKYAGGAAGWRDQTTARYQSWGMNTLGGGADWDLLMQHKIPYIASVGAQDAAGLVKIYTSVGRPLIDPFDDNFSFIYSNTLAAQFNPAIVNDPWCMGYFIDIWETGWGVSDSFQNRYAIGITVLNNPPTPGKTNCAKVQFVSNLTTEYTNITSFNAAWGTSFGSWSALLNATNWVPASPTASMTADLSAYITSFVSAYFGTVHRAFRANDPNHLDLGARWGFLTPELLAGAAPWMDVFSTDPPASIQWGDVALANSSGKPWFVASFTCGATDQGMFSGLVTVKSQQARGDNYQGWINDLMTTPSFVGASWWQYADQSLIGNMWGWMENYEEGWVDDNDTPYYPLVNAARAVHATIYSQRNYSGVAHSVGANGLSLAVLPGLVETENYDTGTNGAAYKTASGNPPVTETCSDTGGGLDITSVSNGDFWSYTLNPAQGGQYTVALRVAAPAAGGSLHLEDINGVNLSGPIAIPASGGAQTWETVNAIVSLMAGQMTLRVVADTNGFNFNKLSFYPVVIEGDYTLLNTNSSLFLAPLSGVLIQSSPDNATDQRWHIAPAGGGYYTVYSFDRTLCLGTASTSSGVAVTASAPTGALYQQWQFVPAGFVGYRLVNRNSGLALDISASSKSIGAGVLQRTASASTASQVWIFGMVPGVAYQPSPQVVVQTWTGSVNSNWDTNTANWSAGNWLNGNGAIFGPTGVGTVNLVPSISAGGLTFNTVGYTLAGGWLTLTAPATVAANADATISSVITGIDGLNKVGLGTLTLAGTNIYTGPTIVSNGILSILHPNFDVASGLTIGLVAGSTAVLNLPSPGTNLVATLAINGVTQPIGIYDSGNSGGAITGLGKLQVGVQYWTAGVNYDWDTVTANWSGSSWVNGNAAIFGPTGIGAVNLGTNISASSLTFNNAGYSIAGGPLNLTAPAALMANADASIASAISGTGLLKDGAGTLTLSGNNSYTGSTIISNGLLVLQNYNSSGAYGVAGGAGLAFNVTNGTLDLPTATFSGTGTLIKSGAGTLLWGGGAAKFGFGTGGLIDVQGGIFIGGSNGNEDWTTNLASLNIASGASFLGVEANVRVDALTGAGTYQGGYAGTESLTLGLSGGSGTFSGAVQNFWAALALVKEGIGTQTLSGPNTYSGATTINAGALTIGGAGSLGGGTYAASITNNGLFVYSSSAAQTVSGAISGSGALQQSGTGKLTFKGMNSYTGGTTVTGGTLALGSGGSISNTPFISLAGGAVFDVSGVSAFTLGASQTLSNSTSTATVAGNLNTGFGKVSLSYAVGTPSLIITNGTLTLTTNTVMSVKNTGATLANGSYRLIAKAATGQAGSVAGTVSATVSVGGGGTPGGAVLQIVGGELYLNVGGNSITGLTFSSQPLGTITGYGISNYNYVLQRTTNLSPATWLNIVTNTATNNGAVSLPDYFRDLGSNAPPAAFYRLQRLP